MTPATAWYLASLLLLVALIVLLALLFRQPNQPHEGDCWIRVGQEEPPRYVRCAPPSRPPLAPASNAAS